MPEPTTDLAAAIAQQLAQMQAAQPTPPPPAAPAVVPTAHYAAGAMPAPAYPMIPAAAHQFAAPTPTGVLLPFSLPLPDGSEISGYLLFGPELAQPHAIAASLPALAQAYPLRVRQPQQQWGNNGGWRGGFGQRGGYGNRGGQGGYGRGGW